MTYKSFTYQRFNLYKGYQWDVNHTKIQKCLATIGEHIRTLVISPNPNYHNLGEFLRVLETFLNFFDENPMPELHTFSFTFACEHHDHEGTNIIGTGGQLLDSIQRVLGSMENLEHLTINELHLSPREAPGLLDSVIRKNGETLEYLELINATKERYPMFYTAMFMNLKKLVISPQQITHDVLMHLLHGTAIRDLVIVQNHNTGPSEAVSHMSWFDIKQIKPGTFSLFLTLWGLDLIEVSYNLHAGGGGFHINTSLMFPTSRLPICTIFLPVLFLVSKENIKKIRQI